MSTPVPKLLGGRYEVGDLIGRGGMAEVHRGYDTRLGRSVAIKILRSDHVRDPHFLSRFRREAHSVAGLNHRSIVAVYDSGEDQLIESGGAKIAVPYIVMEFVDGHTLREILNARGALDPHEASRITEGVLDALAYSHHAGMVHRDIKPANVMVAQDGSVKVMDFGIARAVADTQATMTQTSSVMGTAQYISPEQAEGQPVDARSDLYSTGCLLFELLTGRTPFVGEPVSLTYQHVTKAPPLPSELNSAVPEALDAIVALALTKDRDRRYQNAGDFRDDLRSYRLGRAISPPARAALIADLPTQAVPQTPAADAVIAPVAPPPRPPEPETASLPTAYDKKRGRGGAIALVLSLIAALAVLGIAGKMYLDSRPVMIEVPNVVGAPVETAKARILAADLQVTVEYQPSRDVAKDHVIKQDPKEYSEQLARALITLTVSGGPAATRVPPLVGMEQSVAEQAIKDAGLTVGTITKLDSPEQPKNHVVSSTPEPYADAAEGDSVSLVIATGKVTVPDLKGKTEDEARAILSDLRLPVVTETRESSEPEGTVLEQSPKAGKVNVGTEITLVLAKARPVTQTFTITQTPSSSSTTTTTTDQPSTPPTSESSTPPPITQTSPGTARSTTTTTTAPTSPAHLPRP
ncbi:Stk1 family PASTA domain-containing Ser/Thr kinase [Nostocoides vanveenii]|uniref:non-specific serine/threonine protein kinase n=1 Tax=Nostocoides vanveenii TaxID=330835 RepID=A0ABP4WYX4_9MICO